MKKRNLKALTASNSNSSKSLSGLVNSVHKNLILIESLMVFFGSLAVSVVRLDQSLDQILFSYPGFPKVLLFPLAWYYFLYRTHAWDRAILIDSSTYYVSVIKSGGYSIIAFSSFAYLFKYQISRLWVISNAIVILLLLLTIRYFIRLNYFKRASNQQKLLYIYIGSEESKLEASQDFYSAYGYNPNFLTLKPPEKNESEAWIVNYEQLIQESNAYGVLIGVGEIQDASLLRRIADTKRDQVINFLLSTRIGAITNRFEQLDSPILVRIRESSLVASGAVIKRLFDFVFSSIALLLCAPLLIIVALIIKLTSKGSVFYVDKRVGKNGKEFSMPKFRSMYEGSEQMRLSVLGRPDEEMINRYKLDPRITPIGRFIRRWSIDELPQFWCVLMGTMSVVGPRPVLVEELSQIPSEYQKRFLAKPGLTGLWQISGRKEVPWNERMLRDLTYIDNWNLAFDLVLVARTLSAVVKGKGAF